MSNVTKQPTIILLRPVQVFYSPLLKSKKKIEHQFTLLTFRISENKQTIAWVRVSFESNSIVCMVHTGRSSSTLPHRQGYT